MGELSFFSDEAVRADVMAAAGTRLMYWKGDRLRTLFRRQGLYETYFHSLCSLDVARKLRAMSALRPASAALE